jgi:hypothetical protein
MSIRFLNSIDATTGPTDYSEFDDIIVDNDVLVGNTLTANYVNAREYDYFNLETPSASGVRAALNYLIFSLHHGIMTDNIFARTATLERTDIRTLNYSENTTNIPVLNNTITLDLSRGNTFIIDLTQDIHKFVLNNTPDETYTFTLLIKQRGLRNVNWNFDNNILKWSNNEIPLVSQNAENEDIYSFVTFAGGGTWYGFVGGQNYV